MKTKRRSLTPAKDLLLQLFGGEEKRVAEFLLRDTYFIAPARVRERLDKTGSAAWFPEFVRTSNQHHSGKRKGQTSTWQEKDVRVWDNTKARIAFASFSRLVMAGDRNGRIRGYHVAHIWERVHDPECFTAGWNMCLMPGFLKLVTEQQDQIPLLHQVIQQAAFDLYFKDGIGGLARPDFVTNPGLAMDVEFPGLTLNVL